MLRTHTCGEINEKHIGKDAALAGWVNTRRDHGNLIFIDLRDAYGVIQIVFDPEADKRVHEDAHSLKTEYVVLAKGKIRPRPKGTENKKIPTGRVEMLVESFKILNSALTPPFEIDGASPVSEEVRLKYRYLDLRRPAMQANLRLRDKVVKITRDFLAGEKFVEIETPILTKSTPEGARDYLVPSRTNEGKFYALPQSPQLFKQLLMVSGLDRYYQIARCFRDEDLRADRQPEFTQLDVEMSFIDEEDIFRLSEGLMAKLFKEIMGISLKKPFRRLSYDEAMSRFGTDKPDIRLEVPELKDVTDLFRDSEFKVFRDAADKRGCIAGFNARGCADFSRQKIDDLTRLAVDLGAKGLAYFKIEKDRINSPIQKFFKKEEIDDLMKALGAGDGDLMLLVADTRDIAYRVSGSLRIEIGKAKNKLDENAYELLWISEFPLLKYNDEEKRWESEHHPFTSCGEKDLELLEKGDYKSVKARSYDLVINGTEIASGSIRIHSRDMQRKIFKVIGLKDEEAEKRFGFLMEAFQYGAPPHGGIAFGLDRFITLFTKSESIRDVIAFPKNARGICPMTGAPSDVDDAQLRELHIRRSR